MATIRIRKAGFIFMGLVVLSWALFVIGCGSGDEDVCVNGPVLSLSATSFDCETNGSIDVSVVGGEGVIAYAILPDPGVPFANGRYDNVPPNIYTVFATDENGCRADASVDLGMVSFEDQVYFIFYMNCTYSGCHNAGTEGLINYRLFSNIQSRASAIKESITKGEMPPFNTTTLTEDEILTIQCWVNQGAQFN